MTDQDIVNTIMDAINGHGNILLGSDLAPVSARIVQALDEAGYLVAHPSWDTLMFILDRYYPLSAFPTEEDRDDRDLAPRIVSLIRHLDEARGLPDREFTDDLGRHWEWCGGTKGTWAWRVTALPPEQGPETRAPRFLQLNGCVLGCRPHDLLGGCPRNCPCECHWPDPAGTRAWRITSLTPDVIS